MEVNMRNLIETIKYIWINEPLIEMANIPTKYTGLAPTVMVSSKYAHDGKESKHAARIKVSNIHGRFAHDDNFSLSIHPTDPKTTGNVKLSKEHQDNVKDWVRMNHTHLMKVWHHGMDMDPQDIIDGFKRI
jgi:hypothetical protein